MVVIADLVFSFVVALIFTLILVPLMGWRRPGHEAPWPTVFFVFLLTFLVAWAGGVWLVPVGPTLYRVYWVPFVVVAVPYALLLLAAALPPLSNFRTRAVGENTPTETECEDVAAEAFGQF
jgi:hypothetical protein